MRENPLLALGVPREVLTRADASGDHSVALQIAEANFRTLAKFYHPDRPGGDADYMIDLGDAIEELRDSDALTYYLEELLATQDFKDANLIQKIAADFQKRQQSAVASLRKLLGVSIAVDPMKILRLKSGTEFLCASNRLVNILTINPSKIDERKVSLKSFANFGLPNNGVVETKWMRNEWKFQTTGADHKKIWQSISGTGKKSRALDFLENPIIENSYNQRILGFITHDQEKIRRNRANDGAITANRALDTGLDWVQPEDAWFLSRLEIGALPDLNSTSEALHLELVLERKNQVALSGRILNQRELRD